MLPESPLLRTYRELVARVVDTFARAFADDRMPDDFGARKVLRQARRLWQPVPDELDTIDEALEVLGEGIVGAYTDPLLSPQGQRDRADGFLATARKTIGSASRTVRDQTHQAVDLLRAAGYPPRPSGDAVAQEAMLGGIKSDLRMVCDPLSADARSMVGAGSGSPVTDKLAEHLRRALTDGDELKAWLLASTRWPTDYLEARGVDEATRRALWDAEVSQALTAGGDPGLVAIRTAYRAISDAHDGVPVLDLLLAQTLPQLLDDLAGWRLRTSA